ncbi:MAG: hypothetical protein AAGF49_12095 [Pseudomonadota bacterium]
MRKRADMSVGRRAGKPERAQTPSELPVVAALLVAALIVAAYAAGGPVLDVFVG